MIPSWVEIVGYQHEVVHTGVLASLLEHGDDEADTVRRSIGTALLGRAVSRVSQAKRESRAGLSGTADLVVFLTANGGADEVAVETKVDSGWTASQLTATHAEGVLFAVGMTALAVTQEDLNDSAPGWRLVNARMWRDALDALGGTLPQILEPYVRLVRDEVDAHSEVLAATGASRPIALSNYRGNRTALEHWAYFAKVLEALGAERAQWGERKALISGPLITRWGPTAGHLGMKANAGVYLEFMGHRNRTRSLRIKAYAPSGDLAAFQAALRQALRWPDSRRAPAGAKTCTVHKEPLDTSAPAEAAALANDLWGKLEAGGARTALERCFLSP